NTQYYYRLYAYNPNGIGGATSVLPNVPATWLEAPAGLVAAVASASRIDLSWVDNSGAETQYLIGMSLDGQQYYELATIDTGGPYTFSVVEDMFHDALRAGTTYYFKVMAINPTNGSAWSNQASTTTPMV